MDALSMIAEEAAAAAVVGGKDRAVPDANDALLPDLGFCASPSCLVFCGAVDMSYKYSIVGAVAADRKLARHGRPFESNL